MKSRNAILFSLCTLFLFQLSQAQTILIEDASVLDVSSENPVRVTSILIKNGIITSLGEKIKAPKGSLKINAQGKFVLPGLWDMHAHLAALTPVGVAPEKYVAHGVLHVRDMGGRMQELLHLRDSIQNGKRIGPTIVMAGPTLNSEQPADFHRKVTTDLEARQAVRELKTAGVDFIKIHRATNREVFNAIADESKKMRMPFCGHVPLVMSWMEGSNGGMHTIEHIQTIIENLEPDPKKIPQAFDGLTQQLNGALGDALFAVMKSNHTYFDPTLIGYKESYAKVKPETAKLRQAAFEKLKVIAAKAYKSGLPIITGTDVLYDHGNMLIQELFQLASIGMTPKEILKAATITSAEAALRPELGRIAIGSPAALLILDKNPLDDLNNLQLLHTLVLGKRVLASADIQKLKEIKK